jgi:hypothetical protein
MATLFLIFNFFNFNNKLNRIGAKVKHIFCPNIPKKKKKKKFVVFYKNIFYVLNCLLIYLRKVKNSNNK